MRFMMIVKASEESESGAVPSEQELAEMGRYNEELVKAGVMLDGNGLLETAKGAKVQYHGKGKTTVVDGPFTETKELIAGYWIIDVKSKDEAIEWARRIPFAEGEVEIRKVAEAEDFGDSYTPEIKEAEDKLREKIAEQHKS
ncbi:dehydrogenase [Prauserella sp. PE36]|uniref:YciI family protein n=1 Tax=Prauserella sp. PE36 TaxID=1504709 RepID=UPI000D8B5C55|nr:YciI family protein [Prauserella sp. PE36]PXY29345.1 dehydrogenase [Prauserella coralliicola]RBM20898.1 dehydrogenase [Prauserella sp. PE36]